MKIRRGTHADIPALIPLCREFYDQSKFSQAGIKFSTQAMTGLLTALLGESGIVTVAEDNDGIVGYILVAVFPFHFNPKHRVATELMFYVAARGRGTGTGFYVPTTWQLYPSA